MKNYMTIKQASEATGKHPDTLRAMIKKHKSEVLKDSRGKVLIPNSLLESYYQTSLDTDTEQTGTNGSTTTDQVENTDTKQTENPTEQATDQATEQADLTTNQVTASLIKALTSELEAKNLIIKQQQETIQKIVDQQQQLTGMLMSSNPQKNMENNGKLTSVNPIEEKAREEKVKKGKEKEDKVPTGKPKKRHWWSK